MAREPKAQAEKRIKELEDFLGVSRESFEGPRQYFGWWFDPPRLVNFDLFDMLQLSEKYDIASSRQFWSFVKKLDWPKVRRSKDAQKKKEQWLVDNVNPEQMVLYENRYMVLYSWLESTLSAYVVATGHSPQTGDDGTSDLLAECIGRGEKFFTECIRNPKAIVKLARSRYFYENFHYLFHPLLPDAIGQRKRGVIISWNDIREQRRRGPRRRKGAPIERGVPGDRAMVRHFQIAYSTLP